MTYFLQNVLISASKSSVRLLVKDLKLLSATGLVLLVVLYFCAANSFEFVLKRLIEKHIMCSGALQELNL